MDCSCALLGVVATLRRNFLRAFVCAAVAGMFGASLSAQEDGALGPFRTQVIELQAGWNSVYLELEPLTTDPDVLFDGTPIEIAAAYLRPVSSLQFVDSPTEAISDRKGWNVWYASERDDALLTDLYAIQAHGSYLLYSETDFTWDFVGAPRFGGSTWHPNAYSLVGFPINTAELPTVADFFAGVGAHSTFQVYTMVNGRWNLISEPQSTFMQAGTAYWIYSEGASYFKGPLEVSFRAESLGGMIFNDASTAQDLILTNRSPFPQQLTLSLVAGASGEIPLAYEVRELNGDEPIGRSNIRIENGMAVGPVESGASVILNLSVIRREVDASLMSTVLVVASDAGQRVEVPIVLTSSAAAEAE